MSLFQYPVVRFNRKHDHIILLLAIVVLAFPTSTRAYQICGYVHEFPYGSGGFERGVTLTLNPLGIEAYPQNPMDPKFCFDVGPGTYSIVVSPRCNPQGCRPASIPVTVTSQDIDLNIPIECTDCDGGQGAGGGSCLFNPALSCPTLPIIGASDLDVTYIERTPKYRKYGVLPFGSVAYDNCTSPRCTASSGPYPFCQQIGGAPSSLASSEDPGPVRSCPSLASGKRWPDPGEMLTYTAHVKNKGNVTSPSFTYKWFVDGVERASGSHPGLAPEPPAGSPGFPVEAAIPPFLHPFPGVDHLSQSIEFRITVSTDMFEQNNSHAIDTHGLSLSYWFDYAMYNGINARRSALTGTNSAEDWAQAQVAYLNNVMAAGVYPGALQGGLDRVNIDRIMVTADSVSLDAEKAADPYVLCVDGRWHSIIDPDNCQVCDHVDSIDHGIPHEIGHQLGLIDEYNMFLSEDAPNNGIQVLTEQTGVLVQSSDLPEIFPGADSLMEGVSAYPYEAESFICKGGPNTGQVCGVVCTPGAPNCPCPSTEGCGDISLCPDALRCDDWNFPSGHTIGAYNSNYLKRRGYFGEFLYDTPAQTYVRVLDDSGNPVTGAQLKLYQRNACNGLIDNVPEISGIVTNSKGIVQLPNKSVVPLSEPTGTGHQFRPNPFGYMDVNAFNGTMLVKVIRPGPDFYRWLHIVDLNRAYWSGNTDIAVIPLGRCAEGADQDNDHARAPCDNCVEINNPTQVDADLDGIGNQCDPNFCAGDCDGDDTVDLSERLTAVNIALGTNPVSQCVAADTLEDANVTVGEVLLSLYNSLNNCSENYEGTAHGIPDVQLTIGSVSGTRGVNVTVPISIDTDVAGMQVDLVYPLNALGMADPPACSVQGTASSSGHLVSKSFPAAPKVAAGYKRLRLLVTPSMLASDIDSFAGGGVVLSCTFGIKSDAPYGPATIFAEGSRSANSLGTELQTFANNAAVNVLCGPCGC